MSLATRELYSDLDVLTLKEGYEGEYPKAIHRRGGTKRAGDFTDGFRRLLDNRYIRYFIEFETDDTIRPDGIVIRIPRVSADGQFIPRRDQAGSVIRYRIDDEDDWVMPVHEALKRYRGDRKKPRLEYLWLRQVLAWRGLPCGCAHPSIVEHIASEAGVAPARVTVGVLAAARAVQRILEGHAETVDRRRGVTFVQSPASRAAYWERKRVRQEAQIAAQRAVEDSVRHGGLGAPNQVDHARIAPIDMKARLAGKKRRATFRGR